MNKSSSTILLSTSVYPRWKHDNTPNFIQNLAHDLAQLGWNIIVLAPHYANASTVEKTERIKIIRFRYAFPASAQQLCYEGGMIVNLKKAKYLYTLLPGFFLAQIIATRNVVKKEQITLIHSHSLLPQGLTSSIVAQQFKIPHICSSHGNDVFGLKPTGFYGTLKKHVIDKADTIIANSSATQQALKALVPTKESLPIISASANVYPINDTLSNSIRERFASFDLILIFIGRLIEEKGVADFIDAVAELKQQGLNPHGLILGTGPDETMFTQQVAQLNLDSAITFTGWIPKEEVTSHIHAANIFIAPSRISKEGWQEAQGLTIVEAMYAQTPIIATNTGGIVDMVHHGETGLLVPHSSPKEIAKAILGIHNTPTLAKTLSDTAHQHYTKNFDRSAIAHKTAEVYQSLLT